MLKPNPMRIMIKNIFFLFAIIYGCTIQAQFNTLTRVSSKTKIDVAQKIIEVEEKAMNDPKTKKKKSINKKNFYRLQNELDSLKKSMNERKYKKQNFDLYNFRRFEDSIVAILKNVITEVNPSNILSFDKQNPLPKKEDLKLKSNFFFPLKGRLQISSKFGNRNHPIFRITKMHNGIDLRANHDNVFAILDGVVIQSGWDSKGGGNYIIIKHSNSFVSSYLHLSERYFQEGDFVKAGNIIAKSGNSGNSTGPHLHFSVQENGKYIDPMSFLYDLSKVNNLISTYYEK